MPKRLIIATSIYPPDVGGPAAHFASLAEKLEQRGWDVRVLIRPGFFTLLHAIRAGDCVLSHGTPKILLTVFCARLLRRFRLVVRVGGDFFWERAVESGRFSGTLRDFYRSYKLPVTSYKTKLLFWFLGIALRKADAVVFTSPLLRDIHVPLFGLDERRAYTILNPLPDSQIQDSRFKIQDVKNVRLLYAGRFLKLKNLAMLLEIFAGARKKHPQITLVLVGEGPEKQRLADSVERLGLGGSVSFRDPMTRDEILKEIAASGLVVLPSLSEVSPNLLLDAVAAGTPFLAMQECGLRDALNGVGAWFDTLSKNDFLRKLEELLVPGALERMRENLKTYSYPWTQQKVAEAYGVVLMGREV